MISLDQLALVGKINKTHGIGGELSISFFSEVTKDNIGKDSCLVLDIDGIFTPFFVDTVRPRSSEALLIKLEGIDMQEYAANFVGKDVFMLKKDSIDIDDEEETDGMYAAQLIGFNAVDEHGLNLGRIIDIEDSTENVLFIIETPDGQTQFIPIVDEFISEISPNNQTITFDLPKGLLSL